MGLKDEETTDPQRLKYSDCKYAMLSAFETARGMKPDDLLNVMIQLAGMYVSAICPPDMDTETRQVLAVHIIKDTLLNTKNWLAGLPGDAVSQFAESFESEDKPNGHDEPPPILQ